MDHRLTLCACALLWAAACAPAHVQLVEPPSKEAPVEARLAFYGDHRPSVVSSAPQSLLLEDGVRVFHPSDLVVHLDADAPAVVAAARAQQARADADAAITTGWVLTAVGGALELGGGAVAIALVGGAPDQTTISPLALAALSTSVVGAATAIVGVTVATIVGSGTAVRAAVETETTFLTYDASLRRRLALSDDDLLRRTRRLRATPTTPKTPTTPTTPATTPATTPVVDDGDAPPTASLQVAPLPAPCPGESALRAGVGVRLGRDPFIEGHRDVIAVNAVSAVDGAAGLTVSVELRSDGDVVGVRTQEGRLEECAELISRAALSIAVLLDPLSPVAPLTPALAPSEPTP